MELTPKDALMSKVYMLLITERDYSPLEAKRIVNELDDAGTFENLNKDAAVSILNEMKEPA